MTTLVKILILFLMTLFLSSCGFDIQIGDFGTGERGNGEVVTENRNPDQEFTKISAQEGIMVYVTQAKDYAIKVEADENIIDLIGTDIKDGRLKIHAIENIGRATKKVYVSLPNITSLKSSSGAHLNSENKIKTNELIVDGSSGANINLSIDTDEVEIDASSGANLKLEGRADETNIDASSGGNINAKNLETEYCDADASSGGNLSIHVNKNLKADASSGGNISYMGDPTVEKNKSVSGSVHKY
ncbi:DUF2807 domain-containing protein [Aggregatimonas sangjinii]|uniref:DUF2807 domain-containing protein n=1 Tax=Aggregatimonas sangjinii TaxID=2583587 RepID=A0A5B7SRH4_9FLAO|nr:head GIN domain-containing protein [Aggregatimonas sangjinii]QCW99597.1 DUF2807 domain-containing protein [Aggregatimonas sangjinii]